MIVKKIHQTSKTNNLDKYQLESQSSILQKNEDYQYKLWTDEDLLELIQDPIFKNLYDIWNSLKGIQKADLGRYAVLYKEGGFYADTDIIAYSNFVPKDENILNLAYSVRAFPWSKPTSTNFFMYSPSGNKLFLDFIEEGVRRIKKGNSDVPYTTGRVLIQDVLKAQGEDYTVFDDSSVFNKFCYNSDIPKNAFAVHEGSTTGNNRESWLPDYKLKLVNFECGLKKMLGLNERDSQFPYLTVLLIVIIFGIVIFVIYKFLLI